MNAPDRAGRTALDVAVTGRRTSHVALLRDHGGALVACVAGEQGSRGWARHEGEGAATARSTVHGAARRGDTALLELAVLVAGAPLSGRAAGCRSHVQGELCS